MSDDHDLSLASESCFSEDEEVSSPPQNFQPDNEPEFPQTLPPPNPLIPSTITYNDDLSGLRICLVKYNHSYNPYRNSTDNNCSPIKHSKLQRTLSNNNNQPPPTFIDPQPHPVQKVPSSPFLDLDSLVLRLITNTPVDAYPYSTLHLREKYPQMVYSRGSFIGSPTNSLTFESRFESGNLNYAVKVSDAHYLLFLQYDSNTVGHTQWYYFKVANGAKETVRFDIMNMCKAESLYKEGMKVSVLSNLDAKLNDTQWIKGGENIEYYPNGYELFDGVEYKKLHTLSFTYTFLYENDTVEFAYSQPYTYSQLKDDLNKLQFVKGASIKRASYCRTPAKNVPCEYLLLSPTLPTVHKKLVVLTARVHSGETVSSFMMKGAIDFLVGQDPTAAFLRESYYFLLVPMLNPDGVMLGNNRYDADGNDLNRKFHAPSKKHQPTIYHLKKLIREIARESGLVFYCDMHGHGRKKGAFAYGNTDSLFPSQYKIFPLVLSQICPLFSFDKCLFNADKNKQSTARVTIWKEFDIFNVFTLEGSFFGPINTTAHYTAADYMEVGRKVCEAIAVCHKLGVLQASRTGITGFNDETEVGCKAKEVYDQLKSDKVFDEEQYEGTLKHDGMVAEKGTEIINASRISDKKDITSATAATGEPLTLSNTSTVKTSFMKIKNLRKGSRNCTMYSLKRDPHGQEYSFNIKLTNQSKIDNENCETSLRVTKDQPEFRRRTPYMRPDKVPKSRNKSFITGETVPEAKAKPGRVLILKKCIPIHEQNFPVHKAMPKPETKKKVNIFRPPVQRKSDPNKAFFKYYKIYMIEQELKKYENTLRKYRNKYSCSYQGKHTKSVSEDRAQTNFKAADGNIIAPCQKCIKYIKPPGRSVNPIIY